MSHDKKTANGRPPRRPVELDLGGDPRGEPLRMSFVRLYAIDPSRLDSGRRPRLICFKAVRH